MKRTELERHRREHGCLFHHHGGNHDVWLNPANMRKASISQAPGSEESDGSRDLHEIRSALASWHVVTDH